jgi:hypothetical protein
MKILLYFNESSFASAGAAAILPAGPTSKMVDSATGAGTPRSWRDYYLARYFPPASTLLFASPRLASVET